MSTSDTPGAAPGETLRAYLELTRAPNLFTALADVLMGFLFTHAFLTEDENLVLGLLMAASVCLYAAGVVLNDLFDADIDARQRPERPLPSGRVSMTVARRLGWGLLGAGVLLAGSASATAGLIRPMLVGLLLAGCIVLYDRFLRQTPLGPVTMGGCRMLNVLLGMSAAAQPWEAAHWLAAGAIGVYIAGVTWFSRSEARGGARAPLAAATAVILAGIGLAAFVPARTEGAVALLENEPVRWFLLLGVLGALTGLRCLQAVVDPDATLIRAAVRHCLVTLVFLDAALTYVKWDVRGAVFVLALLAPMVLLARWIDTT